MALSASASWFGASVYVGESRASSGSSARTNVLMGISPDSFLSSAARLAVSSASLFPRACGVSSFWCPQQCMTATSAGLQTASSRVRISSLLLMSFPLAVRRPPSWYSAPCTGTVVKAYPSRYRRSLSYPLTTAAPGLRLITLLAGLTSAVVRSWPR